MAFFFFFIIRICHEYIQHHDETSGISCPYNWDVEDKVNSEVGWSSDPLATKTRRNIGMHTVTSANQLY